MCTIVCVIQLDVVYVTASGQSPHSIDAPSEHSFPLTWHDESTYPVDLVNVQHASRSGAGWAGERVKIALGFDSEIENIFSLSGNDSFRRCRVKLRSFNRRMTVSASKKAAYAQHSTRQCRHCTAAANISDAQVNRDRSVSYIICKKTVRIKVPSGGQISTAI